MFFLFLTFQVAVLTFLFVFWKWRKRRISQADQYRSNLLRMIHPNFDKDVSSERFYDNINGIGTEIWKISTKKPKQRKGKHLIYIMIPGNPGVGCVYLYWFETFVASFHCETFEKQEKYSEVSMFIISHGNHCMDEANMNKGKRFGLEEQIQHKQSTVEHILCKFGLKGGDESKDVVIGGHSIGAYIALHLSECFCVKQLHLWCPTIAEIKMSPQGVLFSRVFALFGWCLGGIQQVLESRLFRWFVVNIVFDEQLTAFSRGKVALDMGCWNGKFLLNVVHMAKDEFKNVRVIEEELERMILESGEKTVWYFAENDHWVKQSTRKDISKLVGDNCYKWEVDSKCKHAIVFTNPYANKELELCRKMWRWILSQ